jgi:hypothetical protein
MIPTPLLELCFGNAETAGVYLPLFRAPNHDSPNFRILGPLFHPQASRLSGTPRV